MHTTEVNVGPVLVVSSSVVIQRGDLGSLRWCSTNVGTARSVFVDIISEVHNIVSILVDDRTRVGREETATRVSK